MAINRWWKLQLVFTLVSMCLVVSLLRFPGTQYILSCAMLGYMITTTVLWYMYRRLSFQDRIKYLFSELPQVHIHRLRDDKWFHGPLSVNAEDFVSIYMITKFDAKEHHIRVSHPKDITRSLSLTEIPKM